MLTKIAVAAIAGAWGAVLTNRGVAVYNDGLRAVMPELIEGRMRSRELASTAFGLSFGLLVGFGIPFSLVSPIFLIHSLWLGTDIIGTWFPASLEQPRSGWRRYWGLAGAAAAGALYGGLLAMGLEGAAQLLSRLPVNIFASTGLLTAPIVFTFAAFPAIAAAYQYGAKRGLLVFLMILVVRQGVSMLGGAEPDSWALAAGMAAFLFYALRESDGAVQGSELVAVFAQRVTRLRRHLPAVAVLGALYALSVHLGIFIEGPQSLSALALGDKIGAISITLARAIAFTPLKAMSALTSGVFIMDGFGFAATAGLASPSAAVALIAGGVVMSLEALSLVALARLLFRFPGLLKAADNMRTAMTRLLEMAALVGGMLAANRLAPGYGFLLAGGLYALNEAAGAPLVRAALGPLAFILVGLLVNLLALFT